MNLRTILFPFTLLLMSCSREFTPVQPILPPAMVRPLSWQEQKLVTNSNDFGFKVFQQILLQEESTNTFISPLSIALALAMAYNGAAEETEVAMRTTLGFDGLSRDDLNRSFLSLCELLINLDPKVIFEIANSFWYRQEVPIETAFISRNQQYYHAEINPLNFSDPTAIHTINQWVNHKTHGKIPTIIDRINPLDIMYLINAIYFKGTWTFQFDPKDTHKDYFYPQPNQAKVCDMMIQTNDFLYYEDEQWQVVDLPYGGGYFAATFILPKTNELSLFQKIDAAFWSQLQRKWTFSKGTIIMPKFKTEYKITLNRILQNLGMEIAFDPFRANFSEACKSVSLYISEVLHKTFLQMEEEGTEAAAVTAVTLGTTSAGGNQGFIMILNRPFVIIIHDRQSHSILFIGTIHKPVWS